MKNRSFRNLCNNFSVNKRAKLFGMIPFVIILIALIIIIALGVTGGNFADAVGIGVDFTGGTKLTVTLSDSVTDEQFNEVRDSIIKEIESFNVRVDEARRQVNGDTVEIAFRYKNISDDDVEIKEVNDQIKDAVEAMDVVDVVRPEIIGATAANDLLSKAGIALAVSVVIILIYIIIRFTLMSGFAAIIALLHDVVIMFCLTVICRVQINSSYVAAMITIIAYSINNTIIIFDRCREYVKPLVRNGEKNIDYKGIGDSAVRDTLTRSIYTTLTTMVTVIFLAILGNETIREFCVPIILGLIAGLYSSVFLATPLWSAMSISFDKTKEKYRKRHSVSYDSKKDEKDEDDESQTVAAPVNAAEDLESAEVTPSTTKTVKEKPAYTNYSKHYKKKNTTFKKK